MLSKKRKIEKVKELATKEPKQRFDTALLTYEQLEAFTKFKGKVTVNHGANIVSLRFSEADTPAVDKWKKSLPQCDETIFITSIIVPNNRNNLNINK